MLSSGKKTQIFPLIAFLSISLLPHPCHEKRVWIASYNTFTLDYTFFRLPEHLCHATQQPWVPSDLIEEKNVYLYHFPCPAPLMCICLASPCLLPRRITNIADSTNHHLRGKKTLFWPSTCRIMYVSSWIGQRLTLDNCETIDYYECWLGTSLFFCRDVVFLPPPWLLTKDRDGIAFA